MPGGVGRGSREASPYPRSMRYTISYPAPRARADSLHQDVESESVVDLATGRGSRTTASRSTWRNARTAGIALPSKASWHQFVRHAQHNETKQTQSFNSSVFNFDRLRSFGEGQRRSARSINVCERMSKLWRLPAEVMCRVPHEKTWYSGQRGCILWPYQCQNGNPGYIA